MNKEDKQFKIILTVSLVTFVLLIVIVLLNFDNIKASAFGKSISSVSAIYDQLKDNYNHKNIFVKIHNFDSLSVNFINSRFNQLDTDDKKKLAEEIANFAGAHYYDNEKLKSISIVFSKHKNYLIAQYNDTLDTYVFRFDANKNLWTDFEKENITRKCGEKETVGPF
jgi:hypothetical protein